MAEIENKEEYFKEFIKDLQDGKIELRAFVRSKIGDPRVTITLRVVRKTFPLHVKHEKLLKSSIRQCHKCQGHGCVKCDWFGFYLYK